MDKTYRNVETHDLTTITLYMKDTSASDTKIYLDAEFTTAATNDDVDKLIDLMFGGVTLILMQTGVGYTLQNFDKENHALVFSNAAEG